MSQCWAYGTYGRCEKDGGHDDEHQIIQSWTDDECVNPAVLVPVVRAFEEVAPPVHDGVLVDQAVGPGKCFVCGCDQAAHEEIGGDGDAMCVKHQCREFVA